MFELYHFCKRLKRAKHIYIYARGKLLLFGGGCGIIVFSKYKGRLDMDLTYKRQNVYALADENELKAISDYAQGYKKFLDNGKTEREVVAESVEWIEKEGYKPYTLGDAITPGDKLYYNNRGKGLFILRAGSADIAKNGVRILVAHVDSPRLDLKQVPLFEKASLAYLKTHYYGGIKKYQWLTIPLALHGVVALKDGTNVTVRVGEDENDPVFYITDLLPHLSQEQVTKTIADGFPAENLNLLVGGHSRQRRRERRGEERRFANPSRQIRCERRRLHFRRARSGARRQGKGRRI